MINPNSLSWFAVNAFTTPLNVKHISLKSSSFHSMPILHFTTKDNILTESVDTFGVNDETEINMDRDSSTEEHTKLRRLKDRMWVREALEDLTAAEFACSLGITSISKESSLTTGDETKKETERRSVDYENILTNLDRRVEDMCLMSTSEDANVMDDATRCFTLDFDISSDDFPQEQRCWVYKKEMGMGRITYSDEQRDALLMRILVSRERLKKSMKGEIKDSESNVNDDLKEIRETLQSNDVPSDEKEDPGLYIREDGTIDWDGALQDRAAVKKFGTSVWARINGQDPETVDEDSMSESGEEIEVHGKKPVTAKIDETPMIKEKKLRLDKLQEELEVIDAEHTALLNSAVTAGSAVANVNFATLQPELRAKIRSSDDALERKKDEVSFQTLNYELERIFTYLDKELGSTSTKGYIPLQDRLNVAEFGLLEWQVENLIKQTKNAENIDSDVLAVVLEQTVDLKRRLGIDFYVTGLTFDTEAIYSYALDLSGKAKTVIAFYGKGIQLFWNDMVFSFSLIGRALQGYTLKPREVQNLRRSFKDLITFIPFMIILICPLSPIGHVFVFGAIQRFFPDFFPSCFTERRQNLLSLYESTEYSELTIEENWKEKLSRRSAAAVYTIVTTTKGLYAQISDADDNNDDSKA